MKKTALLLALLIALCLCAPAVSASADMPSGQCGESMYWYYDASGGTATLIITGSGEMNIRGVSYGMWEEYAPYIERVNFLGSGVETIDEEAFRYFTSLIEITLPDSVHTIESHAFADCPNLERVRLSEELIYIGGGAFRNCTSLEDIGDMRIDCPKLERICGFAFSNCASLREVSIPETVSVIENYTFFECAALETFEFAYGTEVHLTEIESGTFGKCPSLKELVFPTSVTKIWDDFISGGSSLEVLGIPPLVSSGFSMFGCTSLNTVIGEAGTYAESLANYYDCELISYEVYLDSLGSDTSGGGNLPDDGECISAGDIDGNGTLNASDYTLIKRVVLGTFTISVELIELADINKDGTLNATDYTLVKRTVLGTYVIN